MVEGYSPWSELDENRRYCLMDTTNIVEVYRSMPDVIDGVRDVLGDRTLLIMPNVVAESAGVYKGLSGKDWDDLKTLESDIMASIRALGVPVEFVSLPDEVLAAVVFMHANANPGAAKLSPVDKMLFCAAVLMDNVDVMTEDNDLRDAIGAECGAGRTCAGREKYQRRNGSTAWFISAITGNDEPWWRINDGRIEYLAGDTSVAVIEVAGDYWGTVRECAIGKPGAAAAIGAYYRTALPDGYCQCGSRDGRPFRCSCIGNHYGGDLDNGLEKEEAWKFLCSLPEGERMELQSLEWSFRHVNP